MSKVQDPVKQSSETVADPILSDDAWLAEEPVKPWMMPRPCKGQPVIFFYRSTISDANSDVAFVTQVGERVIGVQHRGGGYGNVFHEDDPRLVENTSLRQEIDGVWRFTDVDMKTQATIKDLESRLAEIEKALK